MMYEHPITAKLPEDLGFGERFWYWHGASGRSYIHSIYPVNSCPPLPGAVFVAVRNRHGRREPVSIGRFSSLWDGAADNACGLADELHVHLLARGDAAAAAMFEDLCQALAGTAEAVTLATGFNEASGVELALA